MPVYYFSIDGEKGNKIVSLMDNLSENFGVKVTDALRVETDIEFLVPMLERLERLEDLPETESDIQPAVVELVKIAKKAVVNAGLEKVCPECGKAFSGRTKFCSTVCYSRNWRKNNPGKKSKKKSQISLPNQGAFESTRSDEQARIDAVVENAKDYAPGANYEHHVTGPIMARKL